MNLHKRIPRRIKKESRKTEHDENEHSLACFIYSQRQLMFNENLPNERKVILDGINVGLLEYKLHYHSINKSQQTIMSQSTQTTNMISNTTALQKESQKVNTCGRHCAVRVRFRNYEQREYLESWTAKIAWKKW